MKTKEYAMIFAIVVVAALAANYIQTKWIA
jgi:hypothetical protein